MSGEPIPALEVRGLRLSYDATRVLDGVDLSIAPGQTLALLGLSGSGKSSLLYTIAGFLAPEAGEIRLGGRTVEGRGRSVAPEGREIGFVFQQYALWPHLTALETVAYPMRRRGLDPAAARTRAGELLGRMGVGHLAARRPAQLSGGEQQRVGMARALAREAELLLLDEPTAHLDAPLRGALAAELAEQRARTGAAAVYATHDVAEAFAIADRVAVLHEGRIAQAGTPVEIYERPADLWVARLGGPAAVLSAQVEELPDGRGVVTVDDARCEVRLDGPGDGSPSDLLVRPDWVELGGPLRAVVAGVAFRGPHTDYRLQTAAGALELRADGPPRVERGAAVSWRLRRVWRLSP